MQPGDTTPPHLGDDATTDALPVAPALGASLDAARMPRQSTLLEPRVLLVCAVAVLLGVCAAFIAQLLVGLIALVTNVAFYGRWSVEEVSPAGHALGAWVIVVPVVGGLLVGLMARWKMPAHWRGISCPSWSGTSGRRPRTVRRCRWRRGRTSTKRWRAFRIRCAHRFNVRRFDGAGAKLPGYQP